MPVSIVLLLVYVGVTLFSLRRHRQQHVSDESPDMAAWSFTTSMLVLGGATVITALVAEILVGTLEAFAEKAHLSDFFVAAVIVAIVGNAAEHGGAVVVAYRGKIKLAAEIARRRARRSRSSSSCRRASLVADRAARPLVPAGGDRRGRRQRRSRR